MRGAYLNLLRGWVSTLLALGAFTGCSALPDASGYTAATIQVKQAIAASGEVVVQVLALATAAQAVPQNDKRLADLAGVWAATNRSLDALVAHAESIEQIVAAGNRGAESARQVADSVKRLVDTVKVNAATGSAAKVVDLATDTAAFVYGEYAKHVAAQSLDKALEKFGPSMARISVLIQAQIADARRLFELLVEAEVDALEAGGSGFGDWIKSRDAFAAAAKTEANALLAAIKRKDAQGVIDAKNAIANAEAGLKAVAPHVADYAARVNELTRRAKAGRGILTAAEGAIVAWGMGHEKLVKAVAERKPFSMDSMIAAVVEVRTLIPRWREL